MPILYRIRGRHQAGKPRPSMYLTRVVLTPMTPWGQLYFHVFHRADEDRAPHDHPFDYATFPLFQGYTEEVYTPMHTSREHPYGGLVIDGQRIILADVPPDMDVSGHCFRDVYVPPWRWSKRKALHAHRIVTVDRRWPLFTFVWRQRTRRQWGFWTAMSHQATRMWVNAFEFALLKTPDVDSIHDHNCPGESRLSNRD